MKTIIIRIITSKYNHTNYAENIFTNIYFPTKNRSKKGIIYKNINSIKNLN